MSTPYSSATGGSLSSHYYSASGGSLSSHYDSALGGSVPSHDLISIPEGLAPSLTPDGPPPSPSSPPPDSARFFNKNMMKKLKIVAGVTIVGGIIAGIAGSRIKHKHRDYQDS
jgi:hypothetical protein